MLKTLRYNMKTIIWILVLAFMIGTIILFGMSSFTGKKSETGAAVIINGEEIPMSQYYNYYNRYADFYRQFYNDNYEMARKLFPIEEMSINQLIRDTLLVQKAKEMDINVRDEEIIEKVKNYPVFQTEGQFDPRKWNSAVKNSRADWITIEENIRKDLYVEKLERIIKDSVKVASDEVYDFFMQKNENVNISYVHFSPDAFVEKKDPKKYYDEHKQEFMSKKQYKARHILVKINQQGSDADKQKAREKCENIYKEVKKGTNFLKLALEHSEDTATKTNGGDLGYFTLGTMDKNFEDALIKLKEGEVSPPISTSFGYHIIKLESIKEEYLKSFNEVEIQIRSKIVTAREKELAKNKAGEFAAKAKINGFEKEAKKAGLEFNTTGVFTRNVSIPGIGYEKDMSAKAFELKVAEISEPLQSARGLYVIKIIAKPPVDKNKLKEDYDRLKETLKDEKQNKIITSFYEQLKNSAKIEILINIDKKSQKAAG
ncbi:peptidylprolyl isomerase [Candidatus Desantisbacteria bacterium]|nr:peptidylprolyl isomerase [Candidatus Desantisbacteria bacterium]